MDPPLSIKQMLWTGDKKKIECLYLEMVRRNVEDFPTGTITETEKPDFLIQSVDCVVGVEITRIFKLGATDSPKSKAQDAERIRVLEQAEALATDRGLPPVSVDVCFDHRKSIEKCDHDSIAEQLVDLVDVNMPALGGGGVIEKSQLPRQITDVTIYRDKGLSTHFWQTGRAVI